VGVVGGSEGGREEGREGRREGEREGGEIAEVESGECVLTLSEKRTFCQVLNYGLEKCLIWECKYLLRIVWPQQMSQLSQWLPLLHCNLHHKSGRTC